MLSGETAVGEYPVEAVETIARIAQETEQSSYYRDMPQDMMLKDRFPPHSMCEAASWASRDLGNAPVLVFTMSGDTALYMAKIRNQSPIIALSPNKGVASMLSLAWNTRAFRVPFERDIVELQRTTERLLVKKRVLRKNDLIVVLSGTTPVHAATNFMRVKRIGEK
jgi:pyruvate kinase